MKNLFSAFNSNYFRDIWWRELFGKNMVKYLSSLRIYQEKIAKNFSFFHQVMFLVRNLPMNAKVVDIGCGNGNLLKLIHSHRPDLHLYGCDIWDVRKDLPDYINFNQNSWSDSWFKDNFFDLVLSTQVLEHLSNAFDFYEECFRICKKWWVCYVDVPSPRTLFLYDRANFFNDPTHIKPYTKVSLRRLSFLSWFETLKTWNAHTYPINIFILLLLSPILLVLMIIWKDNWYFDDFVHWILWTWIYRIWKK